MPSGAIRDEGSRRSTRTPHAGARDEPARGQRLQALTGLRAVAALLVVMFHFLTIHVATGAGVWPFATRLTANVIASGYTGVSFFFLLSGFILAYTYTGVGGAGGGRGLRGTARRFWRARFARIYPVYALSVVAGLLLYLKWHVWHEQFCAGPRPSWTPTGEHPVAAAIASFLLAGDWTPCLMTWNAPAWSLSAEAFFYLVFPLAAFGLVRLRRPHLVGAIVLCWAAIAATALAYMVFSLDGSVMRTPWWHRYWAWGLYSNPLVRLPEFLLGVALGRLFMTRPQATPTPAPSQGTGLVKSRAAGPGSAGGSPVPGVAGTGETSPPPNDSRALTVGPRGVSGMRYLSVLALAGVVAAWCVGPLHPMLLNHALLDPLYALLIYAVATGEGPVAAIFAAPAAVLLGEASYAIYILHWPLKGWADHALPRPRVGILGYVAPSTAYFLLYLCIVVAASILSYRLVEQPARRAINRVFDRRRAA